jgi:hypothetical protein
VLAQKLEGVQQIRSAEMDAGLFFNLFLFKSTSSQNNYNPCLLSKYRITTFCKSRNKISLVSETLNDVSHESISLTYFSGTSTR